MTNDTTTLNGALQELGELMANNLESMGVNNVSAENGLTSLANEILNIEPSVSGLNLTTSITLTPEAYNIPKNTSFTLTSILSAEYDDTTVTNVDLSGVLTGANVIFKDSNNNILCTAVTNSNGVAIGTVTNGLSQNATITAYFEGTENFTSCQSSSINIEAHYYELGLTSNNTIIQSGDIETLTATLTDSSEAMENETISFKIYKDGVLINTITDTTDSNGVATISYTGSGIGDVDIVADWEGRIQSEIFVLEDCIYAHDLTTDDGHWSPLRTDGGTIFTEDGFRLGNAQWTDVYFDIELPKPCSIEFNVPDYDCSSQPVILGYLWNSTKTNRLIHAVLNNFGGVKQISLEEYPNDSYTTYTLPNGGLVRFEIKENIIELYVNNNLIKSKSYSMPSSWVYGNVCAGSRYIYLKNMKIKPL